MPHSLIEFDKAAAEFDVKIKEAKQRGTYNGVGVASAAKFDAAILKALSDRVHECLKISREYQAKAKEHYEAGKRAIDEMSALIKSKGKKLTDGDIKVLQSSARLCETLAQQVKEASADAFPALAQYRLGWPEKWRPLLSPGKQNEVEALKKLRGEDMDIGKTIDTLKKRLEEYAARAPAMLKVAQQTVSKGSIVAGDEATALVAFNKDVARLKSDYYDKFQTRARSSLKQLTELNPKQKLEPNVLKFQESLLLNGKAEAKNARGVHKTLSITVDAYKKLAAKLDGPAKKAAATALATAAKELAAMAKDVASITALEPKAEKTLAAVKKLK
jgi:hypothetical protein